MNSSGVFHFVCLFLPEYVANKPSACLFLPFFSCLPKLVAVYPYHSTPAFQSPEQARGIVDHRSDLYSLGVLLFNLYTGQMPVKGGSYSEYRRAHMLDQPLAVSDCLPSAGDVGSNITSNNEKTSGGGSDAGSSSSSSSSKHQQRHHPMFDAIVSRLLVKNAGERYSTAAGLQHDLRKLLDIVTSDGGGDGDSGTGEPATFKLGTREVPYSLILPNQLLIGRSDELKVLNALYDKCAQDKNKSGFCHLQGKQGVGKTTLVASLASQRRNPFFLSYKFAQFGGRPMHAVIKVREIIFLPGPLPRNSLFSSVTGLAPSMFFPSDNEQPRPTNGVVGVV